MLDTLRLVAQWSVPTFIVTTMLAAGLALAPRAIFSALRGPRLVAVALLVNFAIAPAVAVAVARLFHLQPAHSVGLLLLACAGGAPFAPKLAEAARQDPSLAVGLMAVLTAGTVIAMPLVLPILTPGLSISARAILAALVPVTVLPFVAGALARTTSPRIPAVCLPMARGVANVSLIVLLVLTIGLNTSALWSVVGSGALAASLVFISIMFAIGYLGGGAAQDVRAGLGLTTAARNVGAALPVAAAGRDRDVMVMVLVATVAELLVCFGVVALLRRHKREVPPTDARPGPMATTG